MSDQFNRDDKVLAHLVREAGDPGVSPDPHFAATLKATKSTFTTATNKDITLDTADFGTLVVAQADNVTIVDRAPDGQNGPQTLINRAQWSIRQGTDRIQDLGERPRDVRR